MIKLKAKTKRNSSSTNITITHRTEAHFIEECASTILAILLIAVKETNDLGVDQTILDLVDLARQSKLEV